VKQINKDVINLAKRAKKQTQAVANLQTIQKNKTLKLMAQALLEERQFILKENARDIQQARAAKLNPAFIDRLALNEMRIKKMSDCLRKIASLKDPVGEIIKQWRVSSGLLIKKVRVPIGVIAIIYESRPDVTSDCLGLCLKSGNCLILRGGSEAINSNKAIFRVLGAILQDYVPEGAFSLIPITDRKAVDILLSLNDYIDLIIPRGGEGLIREIARKSRIPVIKHYKGICHIYVDADADLAMAQEICLNAKVQRPGTCNAMETMLVHKKIADRFLPSMIKRFKRAGVEIRGCGITRRIIKGLRRATEKDYSTEYLDLILTVKVVRDIEEAISHINTYGSGHSDSIVTKNIKKAEEFLKKVDSACVYHNASTRFTDGYQFGMGAEMGISTDRLHARGPMALEELTTYKYIVYGKGQIRSV
jgi:glutamate-5-semialdehyde dehydrogenase